MKNVIISTSRMVKSIMLLAMLLFNLQCMGTTKLAAEPSPSIIYRSRDLRSERIDKERAISR